jgi:RNA polymerase sigma-70 factor (sigma-E family)
VKSIPSFDEYVDARALALTRFAYVLTNDRHLAEDLVQSALLTAFRNWDKVERADHPEAYVRRIIVTTHLSAARKRRPAEVLLAVFPDRGSAGRFDDPGELVPEQDRLRRALATLPARQRAVLVLRHYAGLDDGAIANILGCGQVAVRAHASKGAAALRGALPLLDLASERDDR